MEENPFKFPKPWAKGGGLLRAGQLRCSIFELGNKETGVAAVE